MPIITDLAYLVLYGLDCGECLEESRLPLLSEDRASFPFKLSFIELIKWLLADCTVFGFVFGSTTMKYM